MTHYRGPLELAEYPPWWDDAPVLIRCMCCESEFSSEDVGTSKECPDCGEIGLYVVESDPDIHDAADYD